jgi:hypothetical protein
MSIEELLQQMEDYRSRREQRDHRPEWLRRFVAEAANLFEPLSNVGRVGYDCQADERGWIVCMYLGTTEIIGGPKDGQIEHAGFVIDIKHLMGMFQQVHRFEWYSLSNDNDDRFNEATRSLLTLHGEILDAGFVQLELLACPPKYVAPAIRKDLTRDNTLSAESE